LEPTPFAEIWKALLQEKSESENGGTISQFAAWLIETLHNPEGESDLQLFSQRAGSAGQELIEARATARIEGKPESEIPALPSPEDLSDSQKQDIETSLLAAAGNPEELRNKLDALSLAEKLHAVGPPANFRSEEIKESTPLEAAIESVQFEIASVEDSAEMEFLSGWKGQIFSPELFETLIQEALKKAVSGSTFEIRVTRNHGFGPVSIKAEPQTYENLSEEGSPSLDVIDTVRTRIAEGQAFVAASLGNGYFSMVELPGDEENQKEPTDERYVERMKQSGEQHRKYFEMWIKAQVGFARDLDLRIIGTTTKPEPEEAEGSPE